MSSPSTSAVNRDKPFVCPVPGCKKSYKNLNGIKYHSKNGHKNDNKLVLKLLRSKCNVSNQIVGFQYTETLCAIKKGKNAQDKKLN